MATLLMLCQRLIAFDINNRQIRYCDKVNAHKSPSYYFLFYYLSHFL